MSKQKTFTALLLMIATIGIHAATYYKWIDPNGVPHYSQYAPTNGVNLKKVQVIHTRDNNPATTTATSISSDMGESNPSMTPEQKRIAELEAQNKAQQKMQDQERCKALESSLSNLNTGGRIYEMDSSGERKYLDSREIELKRQKITQLLNQYCK